MTWVQRQFRKMWPTLPIWKGLDLGVFTVMVYSLLVEIIVESQKVVVPNWFGDLGVINAVLLGVLLAFRNRRPTTVGGKGASSGVNSSTMFAIAR
jgi:hypothetical protein